MTEQEFNLLEEKWIVVMRQDGKKETVSLLGLFKQAHEFRDLAGELPTQDIAVLRFLLAILQAIFVRYTPEGAFEKFKDTEDALKRWENLWERKSFSMPIIEKYLLEFRDRFWLFHPKQPFYQVANLDKNIKSGFYTSAKMNGEIWQSGSDPDKPQKPRLFPQRTGASQKNITYGEAARWLLHVNAFDDVSGSGKGRGETKRNAYELGWLGKLGLIWAKGSNLYETLLLNLTLLKDGESLWEGLETPTWEKPPIINDGVQVEIPDNCSELLSFQSRRLLLKRMDDNIIGYYLLGGNFFTEKEAFTEQMTLWHNIAKKNEPQNIIPRRHRKERKMWRDFSALIGHRKSEHYPGVVNWIDLLRFKEILPKRYISFQIAAIKYNDSGLQNMYADDIVSDSLLFSVDLLTQLGDAWSNRIVNEILIIEKIVDQVGYLAKNLAKAAGNSNGMEQANNAKAQAYFDLDLPFRRWLETIDTVTDNKEQICTNWRNELKKIIERLGKTMVSNGGPKSIVGRYIKEKEKNKETERLYTSASAYNFFCFEVNKILKGGH